jgi:hypothetical protein
MAMVRIKMKANGQCRRGSRHVKGRKGCWGKRGGAGMGRKKKY